MSWCWSESQHLLSIHIGRFQSATKSVSDQASLNTYTHVFDRNSYQTYHRRCHCGGQVSPLCSKMVTKVIILRLKMTVVNHWLIVSSSKRRTCSTEVVILEYQGSSLVHCWAPWPGSPVAANWRTTLTSTSTLQGSSPGSTLRPGCRTPDSPPWSALR